MMEMIGRSWPDWDTPTSLHPRRGHPALSALPLQDAYMQELQH